MREPTQSDPRLPVRQSAGARCARPSSIEPPAYSALVPEGLSDAQIIERLMRLERNLQKIAEAVGVNLEDP